MLRYSRFLGILLVFLGCSSKSSELPTPRDNPPPTDPPPTDPPPTDPPPTDPPPTDPPPTDPPPTNATPEPRPTTTAKKPSITFDPANFQISPAPTGRFNSRFEDQGMGPETAYVRDPTTRWMHDKSLYVFSEANYTLCLLQQARIGDMQDTSEVTYNALIDTEVCSRTRVQNFNDIGIENTEPKLFGWRIRITPQTETSPMVVSFWGKSKNFWGLVVNITGEQRVHALPTEHNAYGLTELYVTFREERISGNIGRSYFDADLTLRVLPKDVSNIELQYFFGDRSQELPEDSSAHFIFSSDGKTGRGTSWRGSSPTTYLFYFNEDVFVRREQTNSASHVFTFDRNAVNETVWQYRLYDATGKRLFRNGGYLPLFINGNSAQYSHTGGIVYTFFGPIEESEWAQGIRVYERLPPDPNTSTERVGQELELIRSRGNLWRIKSKKGILHDLLYTPLHMPETQDLSPKGTYITWNGAYFETLGGFLTWTPIDRTLLSPSLPEKTVLTAQDLGDAGRVVILRNTNGGDTGYDVIYLFPDCTTAATLSECTFNNDTPVIISESRVVEPKNDPVPETLQCFGMCSNGQFDTYFQQDENTTRVPDTYQFNNTTHTLQHGDNVVSQTPYILYRHETYPSMMLVTNDEAAKSRCLDASNNPIENSFCVGSLRYVDEAYVWRYPPSIYNPYYAMVRVYPPGSDESYDVGKSSIGPSLFTYEMPNANLCHYWVTLMRGARLFDNIPILQISSDTYEILGLAQEPIPEEGVLRVNLLRPDPIPLTEACPAFISNVGTYRDEKSSYRLIPMFSIPSGTAFKTEDGTFYVKAAQLEQRMTASDEDGSAHIPIQGWSDIVLPNRHQRKLPCIGSAPPDIGSHISVQSGLLVDLATCNADKNPTCGFHWQAPADYPWDRDRTNDQDCDSKGDAADHCIDGESLWDASGALDADPSAPDGRDPDQDDDGCRDASEDGDDDNDTVLDLIDMCPHGDIGKVDEDHDGCWEDAENAEDLLPSDDDNDGYNDTADACPHDGGGWFKNGVLDSLHNGCRDPNPSARYWRVMRTHGDPKPGNLDAWMVATFKAYEGSNLIAPSVEGSGVSSSSMWDPSSAARDLLDDDTKTEWRNNFRWCCSTVAPDPKPWFRMDMGVAAQISSIMLLQHVAERATQVLLQVSADAATWETVPSTFSCAAPTLKPSILNTDLPMEECTVTVK